MNNGKAKGRAERGLEQARGGENHDASPGAARTPSPRLRPTRLEMRRASPADWSCPALLCPFPAPPRKFTSFPIPGLRSGAEVREVQSERKSHSHQEETTKGGCWASPPRPPGADAVHASAARTRTRSSSGARWAPRGPLASGTPHSVWPPGRRTMPATLAFSASSYYFTEKKQDQGLSGHHIMEPTNCFSQRLLVPLQKQDREGKICFWAECSDT